jgi:hypothetical protein
MAQLDQISVVLPPDVRGFVERQAELDCRTVAGQIRFYCTEAARRGRAGRNGNDHPSPDFPALIPVGESPEGTKQRYEHLVSEIARYEKISQTARLSLQAEETLRAMRQHVSALRAHVELADRMRSKP